MTIETKYNIGEKVFLLNQNKVNSFPIADIMVNVSRMGVTVSYRLQTRNNDDCYSEDELFPTKEELIKSL